MTIGSSLPATLTIDQLVVYTAIFGEGRDELHPSRWADGVRHVAFVDDPSAGTRNGWELRPSFWDGPADPCRKARRHKLLPHVLFPEAQVSLWLDGGCTLACDPTVLLTMEAEADLLAFRHCLRSCLYAEARANVYLGQDIHGTIIDQVGRYRRAGFPENAGLVETGAVLRRHTESVMAFNEAWWAELERGSRRDQLSFNYVAWKLGKQYGVFRGKVRDNPFFHWRRHAAKQPT